jgi:hypothetical protein
MHCQAIPPHNVKKSPPLNVKSYILPAVKKLALAILLAYPVVADLRDVGPAHDPACTPRRQERHRLWTLLVLFVVVWLWGLVTASALGGFIPLLLVIAVVVLVRRLRQGRPPAG